MSLCCYISFLGELCIFLDSRVRYSTIHMVISKYHNPPSKIAIPKCDQNCYGNYFIFLFCTYFNARFRIRRRSNYTIYNFLARIGIVGEFSYFICNVCDNHRYNRFYQVNYSKNQKMQVQKTS